MYILTRPLEKASRSEAVFHAAGLALCNIACVSLAPVKNSLGQLINALKQPVDTTIVTSTAVADVLAGSSIELTNDVWAIGSSTAQSLAPYCDNVKVASLATSEGLLADPYFSHVNGKRILLLKGIGGRTLLSETLQSRGAFVDSVDLYQRVELHPPVVSSDINWQQVKGIIATSLTMAEALFAHYPSDTLISIPWLTVSHRIALQLQQLGVKSVHECAGATDSALIQWVQQHWE